jgi:hypothetical protein
MQMTTAKQRAEARFSANFPKLAWTVRTEEHDIQRE